VARLYPAQSSASGHLGCAVQGSFIPERDGLGAELGEVSHRLTRGT